MKRLPITKRQQVKLREMVRVLYPEYDSRLTRPIFEKDDVCFIQISLKTSKKYNEGIHWFEFCMTHLLNKLCDYSVMALYNANGNFGIQHPIDFFYSEFKRRGI